MSKVARHALLGLTLVLGVALRVWGLRFGLPHDLARPDEEKIVHAALVVLGGDPNPHFFLYPSLFIYLIAAAYSLVFPLVGTTATAASYAAHAIADPSLLHLVPRALSAAAGVATIAVLYAAARELFSPRTGAVAAIFLAVTYLHVRDSHFGTTDVPVALVCMLAFWAAAKCAVRGVTFSRVLVAGLLCGLAASTKYNAVLVMAPALVAIGDGALASRRAPTRRELSAVLLLVGCLGIAFVLTTPFAVLDYDGFRAQFSEQQRIFAGTQNGSIIGPARAVLGGERGWTHYLTFTLRYGLGLPLLFAAVAGGCRLVVEQWRRALLVLSFPAAYYASMGMGTLVYARNMVPVVPFLCLSAGVLVDRVAQRVGRRSRSELAAVCCAVAAVALIAGRGAADSVAFDRVMSRTDTRVQGARWIEARFPAGASLYQTGFFYSHVQPVPADRYRSVAFDERHGRLSSDGPCSTLPDVVVRTDSPLLVYNRVPPQLAVVLDVNYVLAQVFVASARAGGSKGIYDQQDAWYVPFANLAAAERPGPDIYIYERRK